LGAVFVGVAGPRHLPGRLSGIKINTSPTDFYPIEQLQMMMRFKGESWELFGLVINGEIGG
jgi:branched-chain amino acid transport system substrate-binding protein